MKKEKLEIKFGQKLNLFLSFSLFYLKKEEKIKEDNVGFIRKMREIGYLVFLGR